MNEPEAAVRPGHGFGNTDPIIPRPTGATPLAAIEGAAAAAFDTGSKDVWIFEEGQLARAYSVKLHGRFVRVASRFELPGFPQ